MNQIPEELVAGNSDYILNVSDYLFNNVGVPVAKGSPFYIEFVDSSGENQLLNKGVAVPDGVEILGVRLLINPASLSMNLAKIVNRTQTMTAWLEEHWGEEIDTITLQGSTAAFVVGANSLRAAGKLHQGDAALQDVQNQAVSSAYIEMPDASLTTQSQNFEPGITTTYRRYSLSYREWTKLIQMMATNGCIFDESTGFVSDRKFIRLSYDYAAFIGFFESVDTTEDANSPYRFTYTITFKSQKTLFRFATRKSAYGGIQ